MKPYPRLIHTETQGMLDGLEIWVEFDAEDSLILKAWHEGHRGPKIAHALCMWHTPTVLNLGDIRVMNDEHRGYGIGTLMLHQVIRVAREGRASKLTALVEMENARRLLPWYAHHGFRPGPDFTSYNIELNLTTGNQNS